MILHDFLSYDHDSLFFDICYVSLPTATKFDSLDSSLFPLSIYFIIFIFSSIFILQFN